MTKMLKAIFLANSMTDGRRCQTRPAILKKQRSTSACMQERRFSAISYWYFGPLYR
ncbi:MAG: hypothetical protein K0B01_14265 [Syntrophobacterales bacterium]|nr:hypothetical protein [Syntrophobacterales bacterium]